MGWGQQPLPMWNVYFLVYLATMCRIMDSQTAPAPQIQFSLVFLTWEWGKAGVNSENYVNICWYMEIRSKVKLSSSDVFISFPRPESCVILSTMRLLVNPQANQCFWDLNHVKVLSDIGRRKPYINWRYFSPYIKVGTSFHWLIGWVFPWIYLTVRAVYL